MREAFDRLDLNKDGLISQDEVKEIFEKNIECM